MTTSTPHKRRHSIFLCYFLSESVDEVKEIKIRTANIIGKPSPPFLMMAPKGAPIKNIINKHAITNLSKKAS
jgi:hypothetical protein